jgi:hypothetical protein
MKMEAAVSTKKSESGFMEEENLIFQKILTFPSLDTKWNVANICVELKRASGT